MREEFGDFIGMTAATRRSLELTETLSGARAPTLFSAINSCKTPMGARLLAHTLHHPPRRPAAIIPRHDAVEALCKTGLAAPAQKLLSAVSDIERIAAGIALFSARPRDLAGLRRTMEVLPEAAELLSPAAQASEKIAELTRACAPPKTAMALLQTALAEEPAAMARDGGVIAAGYNAELDILRGLQNNARAGLGAMEDSARQQSGISGLRVDYNKIQGFFIEVPRAQAKHAPAEWQRRQTLKNAERFITPEIKRHEEKVLAAEEKSRALERALYDELLSALQPHVSALRALAAAAAELDMLACFAVCAQTHNWRRPQILDSPALRIIGGRHPVVESQTRHFVGNDLQLDESSRLHIITGPNMGGKSTYLRQTALIVLLACCGAFVPAESAQIGIIGAIFTRIGATDDLAGGRSTFMVEMTEAAEIMHAAAADSLVLLDEIGRGTSTYDGLALAWALAERLLLKNRSLTLFATHYFELTALAEESEAAKNRHLAAREHGDE
ncbi:MAG: DNA mismatch repair protein MutS, partial [Betaproteobacteria bacterium]|nr:DNA mismatch repair protein MutS [Betaproteobacteria bacterium]